MVCSVRRKPTDNELGPETGQGFRDYLDFNVEAEALGFHSSFLVEHHFTGWNQVSATLMLLTCLAMRTTTLRLGTAVMVLPWHNPVLLAEQAATLDLISDGRLDFGIGKGYRHNEFKGFGIPQEEAERAFRGGDRGHHAVLDLAHALLPSWPLLAVRGHRGRAAAGAAAASAALGRRRERAVDPPRRGARIQSHSRSICRRPRRSANASRSTAPNAKPRAGTFDPMQVAVARQLYVANDEADKEAALARLATYTQRTVAVSRAPDGNAGSHVLAYADTPARPRPMRFTERRMKSAACSRP